MPAEGYRGDKEPGIGDCQQAKIVRFPAGAIRVRPRDVIRYVAGRAHDNHPGLEPLVSAAIERAVLLASSVFIHTLHPVRALSPAGRLILENGVELELPKTQEDPGTRYLASCLCSLGNVLENSCRRLASCDQLLEAMLLDAAGTCFLDGLLIKSHEWLWQRAAEMHLFAGCPFRPGCDDLPMDVQSLLFQLVDADAIRVRLNDRLVMEPLKTLSFFVRLTESEVPNRPFAKCRQCSLKDCPFFFDGLRRDLLRNGSLGPSNAGRGTGTGTGSQRRPCLAR